jgi:hypothetical protein
VLEAGQRAVGRSRSNTERMGNREVLTEAPVMTAQNMEAGTHCQHKDTRQAGLLKKLIFSWCHI